MMSNQILTVDRLREVLAYDPDTGLFKWLVKHKFKPKTEWFGGAANKRGYLHVQIDKVTYQAHRIAWMHFYGSWPTKVIDHINRMKNDNRIVNLRDVTPSENLENRVYVSSYWENRKTPQYPRNKP